VRSVVSNLYHSKCGGGGGVAAAAASEDPNGKNSQQQQQHQTQKQHAAATGAAGQQTVLQSNSGEMEEGEEEEEVKHTPGKYALLPLHLQHEQQDKDKHSLSSSPSSSPIALPSNATFLELKEALEGPLVPMVTTGCIAKDPDLYCKLCRLIQVYLKETQALDESNTKQETLDAIYTILEKFLVPSLSLFAMKQDMSNELWAVISLLPYPIRYELYASWRRHGLGKAALRSTMKPPKPLAQVESEIRTSVDIRYILKRLSADNIDKMGRQIANISVHNPIVVSDLILGHIESYDNLILMIVEAFNVHMGPLSLDVMGFCLLVNLGGGEKGERPGKLKGKSSLLSSPCISFAQSIEIFHTKIDCVCCIRNILEDGVSPAQWLSSLETFTGAFFKSFTSVELKGIMSYLMKRLKDGHHLELGVFQSLLKMAGGYGFTDAGSLANLSKDQTEGRFGSLELHRETSDFGVVSKVNAKSSRRLRSTLQENGRGIVFLILLLQMRSRALFDSSGKGPKQIKLIGNLYDTYQKTWSMLLQFLTDGTDDQKEDGAIASFAKNLPPFGQLHQSYEIDTTSVWALCRPLIRATLASEETDTIPDYLKSFHPSSEEMRNVYEQMMPVKSWKYITPLLFQTFFTYSIYDLYCPEETYKVQIARLKEQIHRLEILQKGGRGRDAIRVQASLRGAAAAAGGTERQIRDATIFKQADMEELKRLRNTSEVLVADQLKQSKHCARINEKLRAEKDNWVAKTSANGGEMASAFFTQCIYPRTMLSPEDAIYCCRFVFTMHNMETPRFSTLQFLDKFINAVSASLYCTTEDESSCLGLFLAQAWKKISEWRYNHEVYVHEISEKVSFN
jgi:THO complex subunit 2